MVVHPTSHGGKTNEKHWAKISTSIYTFFYLKILEKMSYKYILCV